jgi:DNA-binding NarL/FixJ family response regulator
MASAKVRVLIVDDHDLFRTGLRMLLEEEGFEVEDAMSAAAGIRRARQFVPHVVVMDMHMPAMSGAQATPLVLEAAPDAAVLMLTIAADETEVLDAVRAGASSYLLKDAELPEIVAGIRAAAAGRSAISIHVAGHLLGSVRSSDPMPESRPSPSPGCGALSPREREVLVLVTEGWDNSEIAGRLHLSPSTVKNHVSRLLEKLGVDNRLQAATFAVREGLAEPEPAAAQPAWGRARSRLN